MSNQRVTENLKPQYQMVDILKFFFCVCIIAMHTSLFTPPIRFWIEKIVFRLGVPFFFVASGFFLAKGCHNRGVESGIKRFLSRLFKLLWVFSIVWIAQYAVDGIAINKAGFWRTLLEILQQILFYPRGALWYIQASMVGALMLLPFLKQDHFFTAIILGFALYVFGEISNTYYFVIEDTFLQKIVDTFLKICLTSNNGVFIGFIYLTLGAGVEKTRVYEKATLVRILLITSMVIYIVEIVATRSMLTAVGDDAFYFSQLIVAPLLLAGIIPLPNVITNERATLLRNLSTGMYLLHTPIMWCYNRLADYVVPYIPVVRRVSGLMYLTAMKFAFVLLVSMAICLLAYCRPHSFICKVLK